MSVSRSAYALATWLAVFAAVTVYSPPPDAVFVETAGASASSFEGSSVVASAMDSSLHRANLPTAEATPSQKVEPTADAIVSTPTESVVERSRGASAPVMAAAPDDTPQIRTNANLMPLKWASEDVATIRPGARTYALGAQCTANFVYTDDAGEVYVGIAAHCASQTGATSTDGCVGTSLPLGTPIAVTGAKYWGALAYSSWIAMRSAKEKDYSTCIYNDFALVRLHENDRSSVNPTVPYWGGPTGLAGYSRTGELVYAFGSSSLRVGPESLRQKVGPSAGMVGGGWAHAIYTATPGIPGDSGSAYVNAYGRAVGSLSSIALAPTAGSNNVTDLARALVYAWSHGGPKARLANGTRAFSSEIGF